MDFKQSYYLTQYIVYNGNLNSVAQHSAEEQQTLTTACNMSRPRRTSRNQRILGWNWFQIYCAGQFLLTQHYVKKDEFVFYLQLFLARSWHGL